MDPFCIVSLWCSLWDSFQHSPSLPPSLPPSRNMGLFLFVSTPPTCTIIPKFVHLLTSSPHPLSLSPPFPPLPTRSLTAAHTHSHTHTLTRTAVYWRFSACVCYMVGAACLSVPLLFLLLVTPKLSDKKQWKFFNYRTLVLLAQILMIFMISRFMTHIAMVHVYTVWIISVINRYRYCASVV